MSNKWIKINKFKRKDRPPFNKEVLGFADNGQIAITFTESDRSFCTYNFRDGATVTHWQPLPSSPTEEIKEPSIATFKRQNKNFKIIS